MAHADQSMGDIFTQRRAAMKGSSKTQTSPLASTASISTGTKTGRPPSLAEIQVEQAQENKVSNRGSYNNHRGNEQMSQKNISFSSRSPSYRQHDPRGSSYNDLDTSFRGSDRRDNRGGGHRQPDRSNFPLERGCISGLKDSFGFIYCADREDELFFHFSEVTGTPSSDLQIDDELEFRVGESKNSDKLAAFEVVILERGTVVWEVEENPGVKILGIVETPLRSDRRSNNVSEGTIRMILANDTDLMETSSLTTAVDAAPVASGPLVNYTVNDYVPETSDMAERSLRRSNSSVSQSSRELGKNDLVEFTTVICNRNKTKYARGIKFLMSDRERERLVREKELIANAQVEEGVVITLENGFGFLKSNRRREEVHFFYSHVELPDDVDKGDCVMEVGQDMEFLVIKETVRKGRKENFCARQIKFRPKDSVIFHKVLATGVTGAVSHAPHASDSMHTSELIGKVQLNTPIEDIGNEKNDTVCEIDIHPSDSPGGSFSLREGISVGLWVHEGDTLLFDVVKDMIDGTFRVYPTKHVSPGSNEKNENDPPSVKLISTTFAGRAEGVIHAMKDGYGFIQFSERPVDVYFRLYELMPDAMQSDLRKNMGLCSTENGAPLKFQVGTEVQFDLSLHEIGSRNRKGPRIHQEKENLKAQRILLLPSGTISDKKIIAEGVKGIVIKENPKQAFAGQIELEQEFKSMTLAERHPLVANLISSLLSTVDSKRLKSIVFHDIQATKEDEVVKKLVEVYGKRSLEISHLPISGDTEKAGRICITRSEFPKGCVSADDEYANKCDDNVKNDGPEVHHTNMTSAKMSGKKCAYMYKRIKLVQYDKHCVKDLRPDRPPGLGDVVTCDIIQLRRTGDVCLVNVTVTERNSFKAESFSTSGSAIGIVTVFVAARQFGFISVLDDDLTKREVLYFLIKSVRRSSGDGVSEARSRSPLRAPSIRKGDEVEFDISVGEGGKRCATNVRILSKGTLNIAIKTDKTVCHGIVLMEPPHTTARNTPNRKPIQQEGSKSLKRGSADGRWEIADYSVKGDTTNGADVREDGFILLTKDPSNMFAKWNKAMSTTTDVTTSLDNKDIHLHSSEILNTTERVDESLNFPETEVTDTGSMLFSHLPYTKGATVIPSVGAFGKRVPGGPRRGDLVSFVKAKSGNGVRNVRVVTNDAAVMQRGHLENIIISSGEDPSSYGIAKFVVTSDPQMEYMVDLKEVLSCDISLLKEQESVEGILHEGQIFGICRTSDRYLESKHGLRNQERPKLNLTIRKGLGGTIMAQSGMAKGPDGTMGFAEGWTSRACLYPFDIEVPYAAGVSNYIMLPAQNI